MARRRPEFLFQHNPPSDKTLAEALFYNRIDELQEAVEVLDVDELAPQIYAVHGDSRTGKSHFVQRLMAMLADRFVPVRVNANTAGLARNALRRAFSALKAEVDGLTELVPDEQDLLAHDVVDPWRDYFDDIEPLIEGRAEQVTVRIAHSIREQVTGKLGVKVFEVAHTGEATKTRERTLTVKTPSDPVLVQHLHEMVDVLWYGTRKRVLLYFDDLDLLATRALTGTSSGAIEAAQILELLGPLAENPRVAVLASMRTAFFNVGDKPLEDFVLLRRVDDAFLHAVYELHIKHLNDGDAVFTEPCLDALVRMAAGRVGVFLRHCRQVWKFARRKAPVDLTHLDGWLKAEIEEWLRAPETAAAMTKVIETVRSGSLVLPLEGLEAAVEDGPLAFTLIRRSERGGVEVVERAALVIRESLRG